MGEGKFNFNTIIHNMHKAITLLLQSYSPSIDISHKGAFVHDIVSLFLNGAELNAILYTLCIE